MWLQLEAGLSIQIALVFNLEIFVIMTLLLYVLFDNIISHIATAATEISTSPNVAAPVLFPYLLILIQQFV
jgi:hypothetical protein